MGHFCHLKKAFSCGKNESSYEAFFQTTVLSMLHDRQPGIHAIRALAQFYSCWLNMDKDIKVHINKCNVIWLHFIT